MTQAPDPWPICRECNCRRVPNAQVPICDQCRNNQLTAPEKDDLLEMKHQPLVGTGEP